ncbi:hypothetical protein [Haloterrigena gelatinilytica]|nr:hypothetical protein [Haloterrigena gelatinilytica]
MVREHPARVLRVDRATPVPTADGPVSEGESEPPAEVSDGD